MEQLTVLDLLKQAYMTARKTKPSHAAICNQIVECIKIEEPGKVHLIMREIEVSQKMPVPVNERDPNTRYNNYGRPLTTWTGNGANDTEGKKKEERLTQKPAKKSSPPPQEEETNSPVAPKGTVTEVPDTLESFLEDLKSYSPSTLAGKYGKPRLIEMMRLWGEEVDENKNARQIAKTFKVKLSKSAA